MLHPSKKSCAPATLCLLLYLLAIAFPAYALPGKGTLSGNVYDPRGNPIAARVLWQASDGSAPHYLHTDAKGHFHIAGLQPGFYDLRAEAKGMSTEWEHNILVKDGKGEDLTLQLVRETRPAQTKH